MNYLKLFSFLFFFNMCCLVADAQQKHFIYIQSQNQEPFAVMMDGKVYSSSDYGYVIIPKLIDGDYSFTVNFPLDKFPSQSFKATINKKDEGFFLKNNNNQWALENMQTNKLVAGSGTAAANKNAFGDMLSDVVQDSTLAVSNTPANDKPATVENKADEPETTAANTTDVAASETNTGLQPEKIAETKLDTGTSLIIVDKSQAGNDTVNVFIPSDNTTADVASVNTEPSSEIINTDSIHNTTAPDETAVNNNDAAVDEKTTEAPVDKTTDAAGTTEAATAAANPGNEVSNPFYKPDEKKNTENIATVNNEQNNQSSISNVATGVKTDCDKMLSDDDLDKLKRKMFVQKGNKEMIDYAVKFIKNKCLTTDQVKTLGYLFSSDDGRYNLYDALYSNVYDYSKYPQLANSILDPYYKKRFAALLR